jgi:hypothetical protein
LAALGLAGIVAVGSLAACGDDDDTVASSATTEDTVAVADGLRPFPTDVAPLPADGEDPADGVHAVQVLSSDPDAGTVTVDFIEFLTGDAANEAYSEETGSDEPVPNDYWIRDSSEAEVTLDLADDYVVTLVMSDDSGQLTTDDATLDDLPGDLGGPDSPYWVTIDDGEVTRIDQQYVP